jgi:hypothetical protein
MFLLTAFALENEPFAAVPDNSDRHMHENDQGDNEKQAHLHG